MFLHGHKRKKLRLISIGRFFCLLALFLELLLNQSCADQFFPEFTVEDSRLDGQKALVSFSAQVDPSSAKKNFLFAEDENEIEGRLEIQGNKAFFYPKEKIRENRRYKITVYSGAQDINGNTLQTNYIKVFYTKDDLTPPSVLGIKTIEGLEKRAEAIEISFNKMIDQESFAANFSIEPDCDYFINWSDDKKTVQVKFRAPLLERTLHSVKIEKALKDSLRNEMENDFYWSWTNMQDAEKPSYKIYAKEFSKNESHEILELYENADYSKEIEIVFDKNVLTESLFQGIQIEPQVSFDVKPVYESEGKTCKSAKIVFNERPKWNSEKTLTIKDKITDLSGFCVPQRKILIKNNSPLARPPKLECAALTVDKKNFLLTAGDNFKTIDFPIEKYPCSAFKELPIYFIFSISSGSNKIDKISACEGLSVSSYYAGSIELKSFAILQEKDFTNEAEFFESAEIKNFLDSIRKPQTKLCAVKYSALYKNAEINEKPSAGLIEFAANESVKDDKNNFMEESARLTCNKI